MQDYARGPGVVGALGPGGASVAASSGGPRSSGSRSSGIRLRSGSSGGGSRSGSPRGRAGSSAGARLTSSNREGGWNQLSTVIKCRELRGRTSLGEPTIIEVFET